MLVPCMPDRRNGIQNQDEIRKLYSFGPALRQTQRNDIAQNEIRMKMI